MVIQSLTISKKRKEMKKIFYILAAAIVALGTVACENEGLDNINPNINVDGDTVSFVAGINRTDLEGVATVWDAEDTIVVTWNGNNYEFKNAETGDKNTFKCTADGLSAIVDAESIKAVYSNNKDGNVDSAAGVAGALLEYEGAFGNIAFEVKNAFLKFTTSETVTLTASEGLFGEGTELVISEAGEHYVAINPVAATLEYKVGESMGKNLETTFEAKKIYNLGNLAKAIAGDSNGKNYTELATAFKLAESGATITLFEDIALEGLTEGALMKVDKNLTLNVGEHTLTATLPAATKNASIFTVTKGAEFTLVGAGNIVIENGGGSNIGNHFISNEGGIVNLEMDGGIELNVVGTPYINCIVDNNSTVGAATLNIKKGTYKQNSGNIFRNFVNHKTELATINISGGSIIGTGEKDIYIWNQKMSKTTGILNITAGTFVNVQIDNDDKTLNQVTFTAEGYKLQQNANGYYDVVEWNPVASVGGVEYETFEAALAAAEAGSTIELLADIESEDIITINKNITINGNNKTINSTAARAINIATEGEVTIQNLIVVATGERAVNVINYPATVKLEGVNLTASNYTVNVATSAGAAQVDIKNSTLRGLNTVNINGAGAEVTIDGCEIYCDDNNTTEGEGYAALSLGMDAVGGSIVATNTDIYVTEGSDSTKGCNNASDGTITIDGSTDGVDVKYAAIIYGDYYYTFDTVDEAIEFDKTKTIVLLRDATIGTVGTYTIEVNGYELSAAENFILTDNHDDTYTVVAAKAKVGTTLYATLEEAINNANGATVTLLADGTVSQACQINKNGFTLTVNGNFLALKNYANANGYYDVVAVTKNTSIRMRGSWDASYAYDKGYEGYNLTENLLVFPGISLKKGQAFKIADAGWTVQYGANTIPVLDANKQLPITNSNGADFVVTSDATYDVYLDTTNNVIYLSNAEIQYTSADKTSKIYLKPNSNWTQSNAWFAAYFFNNSINKKTWVKMTKQSDGSYACDVPEGLWENVIFCRMDSGNTSLDWSAKWNQTGDLYRNNVKGNTCAINAGKWDCDQAVTWSTK